MFQQPSIQPMYHSISGLGTTQRRPSRRADWKGWALTQASEYVRSGSKVNAYDWLKPRHNQARPTLSSHDTGELTKLFVSEVTRLQALAKQGAAAGAAATAAAAANARAAEQARQAAAGRARAAAISAQNAQAATTGPGASSREAMAAGTRASASSYGEAMRANAAKLKAAGFTADEVSKAMSSGGDALKIYLSGASYVGCGGSLATARQLIAKQLAGTPRAMFYASYIQCKRAREAREAEEKAKQQTATPDTPQEETPTTPMEVSPITPEEIQVEVEQEQAGAFPWKMALIGGGVVVVLGVGALLLLRR